MRSSLQTVFFLSAALLVNFAEAQTLSETLRAEDPVQLAAKARTDGNIVRGAILFHQGNINCAKCHRPKAEADRIGPDLSRLGQEVTDAFLVESILQPSKVIKKGFETITALTDEGRLVSGLVVKEDAVQLVIRDSQDADQLITIRRDNLDEIRPGKKSSMPDGLVSELKDRQQFLDLLRYVMDVRVRGPEADVGTTHSVARRELDPRLSGLVLMQKLNCVACHTPGELQPYVVAKRAPQLKWSGKRLNPRFMAQFIADPHGVKPGTTMPQVLGHLELEERENAATAIAHYLASVTSNDFRSKSVDVEAVPRGFQLYQEVGCVACHSPRDETALEQPLTDSIALGPLADKYNLSALVEFLEDPLAVRPSGHMPNMNLTHREAIDISSFLLQSDPKDAPAWKLDPEIALKGKSLFDKYNCVRCHIDLAAGENPSQSRQFPLGKLNPERGCLSGDTGNWPNFYLESRDKELIQATLSNYPFKLSDEQQIEVTLKLFNCIACHDRGDFGGVTSDRNPHFQTTNLNLGDQGRIPPTLTGVGAKLKSSWMRDVLVNSRVIRPYMKTRMPQYREGNVGHLVELFQSTDRLAETQFAKFEDQKETRKQGLLLAGNKGLNCVACHTYKYKLSDTMPAVDLTEMADRLKKDWFYQYMLAPQKFSPNTVMPSFWPGGVAIRRDIAGEPDDQIEALWQYLIDGRQAGTPSGVVREPLEIVVTNEAKMLRRKYPDIGKRGIGVGYPGGVNLAFDAEQMRLGSIWKGKFADPGGVWTGQGSGNVRPMGKAISFPKGSELDDIVSPWVVDDGRPPKHQFKGYSLDVFRRPTFWYTFEAVEVEDFFSEAFDEGAHKVHLRRTVCISTNQRREDLSFRIASGKEISREADRSYSIGKQLKVRLVSDHVEQVVDDGDGKLLRIPLDLAAGEKQQIVFEYMWE